MSKIGIVTVLYNSGKVLEEFFQTLEEQTFKDFQLYVIDNASTDNSLALCEEYAQKVSFQTKIYAEKENWGVAKGNNIGIINALADRCEYVLLSNNDIVLNPNTIQSLYDGMLQMKATMAVPKIYFHDTGRIWCAGGKFSKYKGVTYQIGYNKADDKKYNEPKKVEYAPTCFMLISTSVFMRIGLMDESYFVYYDDTDFVWRSVKRHKESLVYIPYSILHHKESSCTGGTRSHFALYYLNRNSVYFCKKNMRGVQRIISLLYLYLHTSFRKPRFYSNEEMAIIKRARKDAIKLFYNDI